MIHVDSYYNESAAQSAGAYANSLKCPVERALNVELGKRAVQHCERLGLIQFPEDRKQASGAATKRPHSTEQAKRNMVNQAKARISGNKERLCDVAYSFGISVETLRAWGRNYGANFERQVKITSCEADQVFKLVNINGYRLKEACRMRGHSPRGVKYVLQKRGYLYDKDSGKFYTKKAD